MQESQHATPTWPYEPILIGGRELKLCMNYRALAAAEDALVRRGHDVNINAAKFHGGLSSTMVLFAAALMAYQPEMDFDEALDLVTPETHGNIVFALAAAQKKAYPDPEKQGKKKSPTKPVDQSGE